MRGMIRERDRPASDSPPPSFSAPLEDVLKDGLLEWFSDGSPPMSLIEAEALAGELARRVKGREACG